MFNFKKLVSVFFAIGMFLQNQTMAENKKNDVDAQVTEAINGNLGTGANPFYLNVPGQSNTGDDGTIDPSYAAQYLKESCEKYQEKPIRKVLRSRTLGMLKQMDSIEIRNDTDNEPSPAERKKIQSERKRIRAELTDILNKNCP